MAATTPDVGSSETADLRVDVAVVGAGVVGLATTWELHRRGTSVAVIDPRPGSGASYAAAGMLAPTSEMQYQQEALFPLLRAGADLYPSFVADLERAAGAEVDFRRTDTLVCAATAADRQALTDLQQFQLRHGDVVESVPGRAARALEPALSPRLAGAFRVAEDHQVNPRRLVEALLAALRHPSPDARSERPDGEAPASGNAHDGDAPAGVLAPDEGAQPELDPAGPAHIIHDRAVQLLRGRSGVVTGVALAGGGRVRARETIMATGTDMALLADTGWAAPPVRPVYGDIIRAALPAGAPRLLERTIRGVVNGVPVYLVPRSDREIVIGATAREDGQDQPNAGGVFRLLRDAQALVPGVADLEFTEVTARPRPSTPDGLPHLGRIRDATGAVVPGLVLATGYFRHGVLLAPLAARLTADLIGASAPGDAEVGADIDAGLLRHTGPHRSTGHVPTTTFRRN